jgi:hypothetical protein
MFLDKKKKSKIIMTGSQTTVPSHNASLGSLKKALKAFLNEMAPKDPYFLISRLRVLAIYSGLLGHRIEDLPYHFRIGRPCPFLK